VYIVIVLRQLDTILSVFLFIPLHLFFIIHYILTLSQNPVSFGRGFRKSGLKPAFSNIIKVAFPKLKFWESLYLMKEFEVTGEKEPIFKGKRISTGFHDYL
jgi:hypothetical protein